MVSRLQELVSRFFPVELLSGLPDDVGRGPDAIWTRSWFFGARLLRELVSRLQESVSRFCPVWYLHACLTSGTPDVRWGIGSSDTFSTGFQEMRYGVLCIYICTDIHIFYLDYIYIYISSFQFVVSLHSVSLFPGWCACLFVLFCRFDCSVALVACLLACLPACLLACCIICFFGLFVSLLLSCLFLLRRLTRYALLSFFLTFFLCFSFFLPVPLLS